MEHIAKIYSQEYSVLYIMDDFNAQTGTLNDHVSHLDYTLPQMQNYDTVITSHGKSLIETLRGIGCCIINGRNGYSCYTCNHKGGLSVVDYIITQACNFDNVLDWKIISCDEKAKKNQLYQLINMKCKLPDHSLITVAVRSFEHIEEQVEMKYPKAVKSKKYNISKVDHNFMNDDYNQRLLNELIDEILVSKEHQNDIDSLYTKFHSIVIK